MIPSMSIRVRRARSAATNNTSAALVLRRTMQSLNPSIFSISHAPGVCVRVDDRGMPCALLVTAPSVLATLAEDASSDAENGGHGVRSIAESYLRDLDALPPGYGLRWAAEPWTVLRANDQPTMAVRGVQVVAHGRWTATHEALLEGAPQRVPVMVTAAVGEAHPAIFRVAYTESQWREGARSFVGRRATLCDPWVWEATGIASPSRVDLVPVRRDAPWKRPARPTRCPGCDAAGGSGHFVGGLRVIEGVRVDFYAPGCRTAVPMIIAGAYCDAIGRVDLAAGHGQPIAVEDVPYFTPSAMSSRGGWLWPCTKDRPEAPSTTTPVPHYSIVRLDAGLRPFRLMEWVTTPDTVQARGLGAVWHTTADAAYRAVLGLPEWEELARYPLADLPCEKLP